MEPIKIEDKMREKFQERELQPSEDAWKRLESRLGPAQTQQKGGVKWLAVAAAFIGIVLLATLIFNSEQVVQGTELVDREASPVPDEKNKPEMDRELVVPAVEENSSIAEEQVTPRQVQRSTPQQLMPKASDNNVVSEKGKDELSQAIAANTDDRKTEKVEKAVLAPLSKEAAFEELKVEEIVAEVKKLEATDGAATPEEIDALLAQAQREIATNRILNSSSGTVDAAALLLDVEIELERSFRDKVFDALGDGYKKIRTAVVERNY